MTYAQFSILGIEECPRGQQTVSRERTFQRFLSQPFLVAEIFTGTPGKYVELSETIRGFKEIVEGKHDSVPEQAFYMAGGIDEVLENAAKMAS